MEQQILGPLSNVPFQLPIYCVSENNEVIVRFFDMVEMESGTAYDLYKLY